MVGTTVHRARPVWVSVRQEVLMLGGAWLVRLWLIAVMLAAVQLPTAQPVKAQDAPSQTEADPFTWWMEPRYEQSWTSWDEPRSEYNPLYVYPTSWFLGFDACNSPLGAPSQVAQYMWRFQGLDGINLDRTVPTANCRLDQSAGLGNVSFPAQGRYLVTLTVDLAAGGQVSASMEIQVTDLLIVSIGDSNASGEGNPIAEALTAKRWYDDRCHRSDISGHALAAKRLEESDPHTSVTFLSFACSGAKVLKGLVLYYRGIDTPVEGFLYRPEPQLKAIMMALCAIRNPAGNEAGCREDRRQVDALLISIGVNDLGFSSVIRSCANLETISNLSTDDLLIPGTWSLADHLIDVDLNDPDWWKKLASTTFDVGLAFLDELIGSLFQWLGNWAGSDYFECTEELDPLIDMNMASLWSHFDLLDMILDGQVGALADELQNDPESYRWLPPEYRSELLYRYGAIPSEMQRAVIPKAVYITSYPADLFHDANGYRDGCGNFAGVSHDEAEWIYRTGVRLNRLIELNASKHRWYYVSGITEAFQNHGYCAGDDSYYIGLTESIWRQLGLDGTVHPNRQGHPQAALKVHELYTADKPSWEEQHLVQITLEAVRVIDNSEFGSAEKKVNIYISDRWLRLPPLLIQPTIATGDWVSLTDGTNDVSYSARLAYDEHVRIQTQTSIGGGIFYPPKCNRPDCAQIIPPTKLATDRTYSPDNGFGRSTPWCEQTSSSFGRYTLSCTASTSDADGSFDLRFRVSYTSLALFPGVITDPHQVVCGPYCDAGSSQSQYPELAAYTKAISDTAAVQTLLNNLASDRLTDGEYFDFGGANDRAYAMTVQPDGKIILAGETETGGADGREAALIRLHSPGIVDESFGLDGRLLGGTAGDDGARAVAIDAEGRLVVVGYLKDANADWAMWRYHPDGSLDTSFGGAGYVTLDFGFGDDYALALAIQPDQRLLVAGHAADSSGGRDFAVARYLPGGQLDPSFGSDGRTITDAGAGFVSVKTALLQDDGKLIVAGGHAGDFLLVRYTATGMLDPAFGGDGKVELDNAGRNDEARGVLGLDDGRLAVGGFSSGDFALVVLNGDGSVCPCHVQTAGGTAAGAAWLLVDFGGDDVPYALIRQPDNKLIIGGGARGQDPAQSSFYLARLSPTASGGFELDPSFDGDGKVVTSHSARDVALALALDRANRLLVAGYGTPESDDDFALLRLETGLHPPQPPPLPAAAEEPLDVPPYAPAEPGETSLFLPLVQE